MVGEIGNDLKQLTIKEEQEVGRILSDLSGLSPVTTKSCSG